MYNEADNSEMEGKEQGAGRRKRKRSRAGQGRASRAALERELGGASGTEAVPVEAPVTGVMRAIQGVYE